MFNVRSPNVLLLCFAFFSVIWAAPCFNEPLEHQLLHGVGQGDGKCVRATALAKAALEEPSDALKASPLFCNKTQPPSPLHMSSPSPTPRPGSTPPLLPTPWKAIPLSFLPLGGQPPPLFSSFEGKAGSLLVGGRFENVKAIASKSGHNSERALRRWVKRQAWSHLVPALYVFQCNYADRSEDYIQPRPIDHSALLPHEVYNSLYTHAPEVFRHLVSGTNSELEQWWQEAQRVLPEWHARHPAVQQQPDPTMRVPLGIHGDDAGMQGKAQVLCLTWGSLVRRLPTLDTRIAFTMIRVSDLVPNDTLQTVYDVLAWSFTALASGKFPSHDHEGVPFSRHHHPERFAVAGKDLADGLLGVWGELRGDWKFLKEALLLEDHYLKEDKICHLCDCKKLHPTHPYTDFSRATHASRNKISHDAWMAAALAAAIFSPLILIPGFHIWNVFFDVMHTYELGTPPKYFQKGSLS